MEDNDPRPSPFDQKLPKAERKSLASRVRALLTISPRSLGEIADALQVEPEVIVIALRVLRARKRGRLRSTIRLGHVSWWWEPPVEPVPPPTSGAKVKGGKPKEAKTSKDGKGRVALQRKKTKR